MQMVNDLDSGIFKFKEINSVKKPQYPSKLHLPMIQNQTPKQTSIKGG